VPHDKNNREIKVGDEVVVRCRVTAVCPGEEACNVTVEVIDEPLGGAYKPLVTMNTKQMCKVADGCCGGGVAP
jgi:hypothetical protein